MVIALILVDLDTFCKVVLQPLPAGDHTIHFRGAYVDVTALAGARTL